MNNELLLLGKLTEELYRETNFPMVQANEVAINSFIKLASNNNLLFYASKKILDAPSLPKEDQKRFQEIVSEGEQNINRIGRSLEEIHKHLPNCLILKTFRGTNFTRIPQDIDVLSQNCQEDVNRFVSFGYKTSGCDPKDESAKLFREDMIPIHLHGKISWAWDHFFDHDFVYQNPRMEHFNGQDITIPNITADVLIHLAHMNFEPLYIGLGELLYLFAIIPKMNFSLALEQTEKYRWKRTFIRTLNLINNLHYHFYGEALTQKIVFNKVEFEKLVFPYCFSRTHLILLALEKRLLIYLLKRIFKVINILISGDSFTRYVTPSDRETKKQKDEAV